MPGATPNYGFPYPVLGDSPHGPDQLQSLATAIDTKLLADAAALTTLLNSRAPLGESQSPVDTVFGTTSSTSWTDTLAGATGPVTLAIVAPPSGKVAISITASARCSNSNFVGVNFRLSGAGARAAVDGEQAFVQGTNEVVVSKENLVSGLTPGAAYTITMQHKTTGGTATFNYRRLGWRPIAG